MILNKLEKSDIISIFLYFKKTQIKNLKSCIQIYNYENKKTHIQSLCNYFLGITTSVQLST